MGKTTIEVTDERKEQLLDERLDYERNYDETIARLLGDYDGPIDADDVATQITAELDIDATDAKDEITELKELLEATKAEVEGLDSSISASLDATERSKIAREVAEELR